MATPPACDFGWNAVPFTLVGTDGKPHALQGLAGPKGLLLMFICNHCPYVLGVLDRLKTEAEAVQALGFGVAAICANDAEEYPEDSFEKMAEMAEREGFPFPYLHDETQEVARLYGAACTPDFFGFNADLQLQYRGRLDSAGKGPAGPDTTRELYEAMKMIAETGEGPREQVPSMGCSIKWKAA
ncbi:thioredoxin family protein [Pseudoroseicyclus tamaricis]|uniref:Thioredoxin family protein n=1 Tax=Pseudoroseicyclus tamaricis TaxID=2705421 RepID=A0A6B2JNV3_9RHOB|nr:thioredoxin family protein [Pseudoroseicyclus tamaricis]NDU99614.1 thioredoxin family protein [Pseudoroseicyclus tamaricis]